MNDTKCNSEGLEDDLIFKKRGYWQSPPIVTLISDFMVVFISLFSLLAIVNRPWTALIWLPIVILLSRSYLKRVYRIFLTPSFFLIKGRLKDHKVNFDDITELVWARDGLANYYVLVVTYKILDLHRKFTIYMTDEEKKRMLQFLETKNDQILYSEKE